LIGGISLLSGYINKVRKEEKNVLYLIAGDMVQGSLIDTEYKGVSTMEIMNYLSPDVVTLGNHELDYGLPHLLFLEKMANFPIVNANLYIKKYHKRLMRPHVVLNVDGFDILFIGIITDKVLNSLKLDSDVGTFIGLEDASAEVGKICNAYKDEDIDLTILLTHIGFDSDKELAKMLKPEWGVDMIIGGHSHTILEQPEKVNNILIAQAGTGTDQIGRFDIVVDDKTNSITEWKWKLIPVDKNLATPDPDVRAYIDSLKDEVDKKYNAIISRIAQQYTHPRREEETTLGNLIADAFWQCAGTDIVFVGSGSIRGTALGPMVTLGSLQKVFPYDDSMLKFKVTGAQIKSIFKHIMRIENRDGEGECYQVNKGVSAVYNDSTKDLEVLEIGDKPVQNDSLYTIGLQNYHYKNSTNNLGLTNEELSSFESPKVISTSLQDILIEYMSTHQNLTSAIEGRLVYTV
jgi:5'-nucleotidase / UDP-sugar diphosphatase